MPPVRVSVNGYGTIGKRVADAVTLQPDLRLVGIAKTRPNFEAEIARARGYPIFVAGDGDAASFRAAGLEVAGGLEELVAHFREDYVARAVQWAADLDWLAEIRAGLRARVAASPLCDGPRFAAKLLATLRGVWREWCVTAT